MEVCGLVSVSGYGDGDRFCGEGGMENCEDGGEDVDLSDCEGGGSGADLKGSKGCRGVLRRLGRGSFFCGLEDVWWRS